MEMRQLLIDSGFIPVRYEGQEGEFLKKTLRVDQMPSLNSLVIDLCLDGDEEVYVEVVSEAYGGGVQMGIMAADYYEEAVPLDSTDGQNLLREAGVPLPPVSAPRIG